MRMRHVVLALVGALHAQALGAQQEPPPPLPMADIEFPGFEERTLSNGARVLLVPQHEVPFVTINLVLPGGAVADPEGKEGVASFVAQLLTRGTEQRPKEELSEAIDFLGAALDAGASDDWITVSLATLAPALEAGLELMADVVVNPTFLDEELELLRTQTLSALQVQLGQAGALASRAFARHVYGSHAYGRLVTPGSVQALDRAAVVAYHETWFSPDAALFVIAGDIEADRATTLLEDAFADWERSPVPERGYGTAPGRVQPEIVIVHRPGAVQSEVRAGHLVPAGDLPEWTALSVANQILGGGSSGRLFQVLREERGYTYGASSALSRRRDRGTFMTAMAVRNDVTGEAVSALLELIEGIRAEPIPEQELADTKDFLIGSFPLQVETPQQVAGQVMRSRLLGLPDDAIETFRDRVARLEAGDVQAVAREHLRPQDMLIVVAGDATRIRSQLASLGHVRVEGPDGEPIELSGLEATSRSEPFDVSGIGPDTLRYRFLVQGTPVGTVVRTVTRPEPGRLRFASAVDAGVQSVEQEVVVTDSLHLISSRNQITAQGQTLVVAARTEGGRITGSMGAAGQERPIDLAAPPDVMVSDMVELALWVADLEVGKEIRVPMAVLQTGSVQNVTLTVAERAEVTVPAGTFDAFRVEMSGAEAQAFWVRADAPHVALRIESRGQPVVLELTEGGVGG